MEDFNQIKLSVVIPVYNEDKNIEQTLKNLADNIKVSHEVIVVYDFEKDTTLPVVQRLKEQYKNLYLVKNNVAPGPSGALRTGFSVAKAPYVLVTMADLCDDLTQISTLLSLAHEKADVICPSRYCKGGNQELKESPKKWAPRFAGFLIRFLSGIPTYDPTNSFKLYNAEILKRVELKSTVSFSVTLEIVAKAHCLGYRIAEIPTVWKDRQSGKSNFRFFRSLYTYLPWFGVAMLHGRFLKFPDKKLQAWFSKPIKSENSMEKDNSQSQQCQKIPT